MRKIIVFTSIFLFFLLSIKNSYTSSDEFFDTIYSKSVKEKCDPYNKDKKSFKTKEYKKADSLIEENPKFLSDTSLIPFEKAKEIYRDNQNSIYQCALTNVQERSIINVKTKILEMDKTGDLKGNIETKLDGMLTKITATKTALGCTSSNSSGKDLLKKIEVLNESTYELCKYQYYMNYLISYYNNPSNLIKVSDEKKAEMGTKAYNIGVSNLAKKYGGIIVDINTEKKRAFKIYPLVFEAYSEYENNFSIHILLTIIRDDYNSIRNRLGQALAPINQVVYKIKDAMSIN